MASARIGYNPSLPLGRRFRDFLRHGVEFRKEAEELQRILDKFVDDDAAAAAATGIPEGSIPLVKNLLAGCAAETAAVTLAQIDQAAQTSTRQLLDAMG